MHTIHYTPHQGSMTQTHPQRPPVGERILEGLRYVRGLIADKEDIDRRVIETHQIYLPSHFNVYEKQVLYPANSSNLHAVHRFDYKIFGELYNVYTRELPDGKQLVTSMWDRTTKKQIDDLEILVKKHNHHIN